MNQTLHVASSPTNRRVRILGMGLLLVVMALPGVFLALPGVAQAQDRPPRQIRTYVPPDQLVSFNPSTPFDQFLELINPIFQRVTGKQVIDPEGRTEPIGVTITSLQFFDALEFVLELKNLWYRETDRYFIVEPAPTTPTAGVPLTADASASRAVATVPATLDSREIQINAFLFDINLNKAREAGVDWSAWFGANAGSGTGSGTGGGGGSVGGGTGNQQNQTPQIFINTEELFDATEGGLIGPDQISITSLAQLIRFYETEGIGKTIANPSVTVQSSQEGNIQIGSDIPVQTRDFAGNTITQFFQTGIIINVTPTLLSEPLDEAEDAPLVDFIHMNISVENSSGRPGLGGTIIDRNQADTQVLLLDGEQTIIGGLYRTEESVTRRGIPILKDLPPWFFGLRYLFSYNRTDTIQRELIIVLQARVLDPLRVRSQRPYPEELIEQRRRQIQDDIRRIDRNRAQKVEFPRNNE